MIPYSMLNTRREIASEGGLTFPDSRSSNILVLESSMAFVCPSKAEFSNNWIWDPGEVEKDMERWAPSSKGWILALSFWGEKQNSLETASAAERRWKFGRSCDIFWTFLFPGWDWLWASFVETWLRASTMEGKSLESIVMSLTISAILSSRNDHSTARHTIFSLGPSEVDSQRKDDLEDKWEFQRAKNLETLFFW